MRKQYRIVSFHKVMLLVTNDPEVLLHNKEENSKVCYLHFCQGMLTKLYLKSVPHCILKVEDKHVYN